MSLPRCSDPRGARRHARFATLVLAGLLVAGCASGPTTPRSVSGSADGIDPRLADVPTRALTLYEQAASAMAAGDSIDAELRFQEFLLHYPQYPGAHVNLAIIFADRGDDAAARASLGDALALNPQHAQALNQLGMLERRGGDFLAAEAAYQQAVAADPEYALAHYNLGVLYDLYLQRLDAALQHYEAYQGLVGDDEQVAKWIADLTRRLNAAQRTANVTE